MADPKDGDVTGKQNDPPVGQIDQVDQVDQVPPVEFLSAPADEDSVVLRTDHNTQSFDPGEESLPIITRAGVRLTLAQADQIYPIAAASGVALERVDQ